MKLNEHTALLTPKILLVPYSEHHVPTYHEWMQDEDLQKATASEPLTLPEEYSMQKSWRSDVDKLTFIACTAPVDALKTSTVESKKHDTPPTMIGDVNLFLTPDCSSDSESSGKDDEEGQHMKETQALIGEIEIMIASPLHQGLGLGHSILLTFLWYMISYLRQITDEYSGGELNTYVKYLRVKIDKENVRSIRLFEKVGFEKVSEEANYFGELELRCSVSSTLATEIEGRMESRPVIAGYK